MHVLNVFSVACLLSCLSIPYCLSKNATLLSSNKERNDSRKIYLLAVIDTESLYERYRTRNPSKDVNNPTGIDDNAFVYLVAQQKYVVSGQASAHLHIQAKRGDQLRFVATSETINFENSVVLYHVSESPYWTKPILDLEFEREVMFPLNNQFTKHGLFNQRFAIVNTKLKKPGVINYAIRFAIYYRTPVNIELFGFFWFDPKVTVTRA